MGIKNPADWIDGGNLAGAPENTKMVLPIEALGISFTAKNTKGVVITPSALDFQNPAVMNKAIEWMGFEAKLKEVSEGWNNIHEDGGRMAKFLYETGEAEGNPLDKGDTGTVRLLLSYGMQPNAPWAIKALRRLMRSETYKVLGRSTNKDGTELFIAPNVRGDLSIPLYAKFVDSANFKNLKERVAMQYGGAGINSHQANRRLGSGKSTNITNEMFIFRNEHGIDEIIEYDGKNFRYTGTFTRP